MAKRPKKVKATLLEQIRDNGKKALRVAKPAATPEVQRAIDIVEFVDSFLPDHNDRQTDELLKTLKSHAADIESIDCDLEELAAAVNQTVFQYVSTASEVKKGAYRVLLKNFARGKPAGKYEIETYVRLLDSITELHMNLLAFAQDRGHAAKLWQAHVGNHGQGPQAAQISHIPEHEIRLHLIINGATTGLVRLAVDDLVRMGLLTLKADIPQHLEEGVTLWFIWLSEFGKQFIDWITE